MVRILRWDGMLVVARMRGCGYYAHESIFCLKDDSWWVITTDVSDPQ